LWWLAASSANPIRHQLNLHPKNFLRASRVLNSFISFVREQHPEVTNCDFKVRFPKVKTRITAYLPLEQSQEANIGVDVLAMIIDACVSDTKSYYDALENYIDPSEQPQQYGAAYARRRYWEKKLGLSRPRSKPRLRELLTRAVKAQAVILAACTGRRAGSICSTRLDVKTEEIELAHGTGAPERGVMVRFREMKIRNVDEDVFCPNVYGELALKAITTAKDLTARIRQDNPQWQEYLFLINAKARGSGRVLSPHQINEYLNGQPGSKTGLVQRFNIPIKKMRAHNFRHRRASNLWLGGLQIHEIAYDLGHMCVDMTIRHYVVGNEESRRRLQFLINHKALNGVFEDFVGGKEMVEARLGRQNVQIMRKQGRIISPTRYGYCCLPAASGPRTMTTPCYVGPGATAGGCDHHILSPDALPVLLEDREVLVTNIEAYSGDPEFNAWVSNQKNQLAVVERTINRAATLAGRAEGCGAAGGCKCGSSPNK
jgi:integrase